MNRSGSSEKNLSPIKGFLIPNKLKIFLKRSNFSKIPKKLFIVHEMLFYKPICKYP